MSAHHEVDRVECGCGGIYANNCYLKLHILQEENKVLRESLKLALSRARIERRKAIGVIDKHLKEDK